MSIFAFSPVRKQSRSQIPLSKMHTTTADFFRWDVSFCMPLVAKDVVSLNLKSFVDSGPNPFPINGSASFGQYAFFVPERLVWEDSQDYHERLKTDVTPPYFTLEDLVDVFNDTATPWYAEARDDAAKYIGNIDNLATAVKYVYQFESGSDFATNCPNLASRKISAIPLRMANRAWFDWMRDKIHISDTALTSYCKTTGGHISKAELIQLCAPRYRCFQKNYFTTCFDSPQEGASGSALGVLPSTSQNAGIVLPSSNPYTVQVQSDGTVKTAGGSSSSANNVLASTPINNIRYGTAAQQLAERLLMAGKTRLSRALALFNTAPTIEELQMSNYLGGHEEDLFFKTSMVGASTALKGGPLTNVGSFGYDPNQGTLAGQKYQTIETSSDEGATLKDVTYSTDEIGYLFVFSCITPHVQYYQGLPRNWTRGLDTLNSDVNDYFNSDFENQPLQPVMNYEVCLSEFINPKGVFGFQLMYSDYKVLYDSLGGDFMNPASSELFNSMHLGRDIEFLCSQLASGDPDASEDLTPYLTPANLFQSSMFDKAMYDSKFTIENSTLDHFIVNHKISVLANRPMEKYCLPSMDSSLSQLTPKDMIETGGFNV